MLQERGGKGKGGILQRKEEGYNLADESALGTLWKIYKCSEDLNSGEKQSMQNASEVEDAQ